MAEQEGQPAVQQEVPLGRAAAKRQPWWRSIGPALITACVVFGPGSLVISSNVGAKYGYDLLWLLVMTGVMMGTFMTMSARVAVVGGGSLCTLIASRLGRVAAAILGINLCLICAAFQFSNNLAVALAFESFGVQRWLGGPDVSQQAAAWINTGLLAGFNVLVIASVFVLRQVYKGLERIMKVMVAVVLVCFLVNLFVVAPGILRVLGGLVPGVPENLSLGLPVRDAAGRIDDSMVLIASLLGTTFSVAAAFFQGNLVREKGWGIEDYRRGIGDSIAGVAVLTGISTMIMITSATVLRGKQASDIAVLATQLRPLLGPATGILFSIGLFAVAMNPFVINAMIGGTALADGLGKPARLSDRWPRRFTVLVLLIGMGVAMLVLRTPQRKVEAMIFGQALTVIGNPLMAAAILWLANRKDIMGSRRNTIVLNVVGGIGFLVVLVMAIRVLYRLILQLS